jgi:hypothetical protein
MGGYGVGSVTNHCEARAAPMMCPPLAHSLTPSQTHTHTQHTLTSLNTHTPTRNKHKHTLFLFLSFTHTCSHTHRNIKRIYSE